MDDEELEEWRGKGAEGSGCDHSCGWHRGWQEIKFWMCGMRGALHQKGAAAFLQQYLADTSFYSWLCCTFMQSCYLNPSRKALQVYRYYLILLSYVISCVSIKIMCTFMNFWVYKYPFPSTILQVVKLDLTRLHN